MFIDTHAHLNLNQFDNDRDQAVERALQQKVTAIINVGIDIATSRESIALAERSEHIYAAAGMHPNESARASLDYLKQINSLLKHSGVVAIGEIGLDYYRDDAPADIQQRVLREQLDLAVMTDMPVIIHTRQAWDDILRILKADYNAQLRGVFHCFSGNYEQAQAVLDLGFHISFTGVLTFKNAKAAEIAARLPLDRLLLETDSPFMAPVPHRGKRCEPAYVPLIAEKLAAIKAVSIEEVAEQTTANARKLFRLK